MWFDFNLHCPEGRRWADELLPSSNGHLQSSRMWTQSRKHFVSNKSGVPRRKRLTGLSVLFCLLISTCTVGLMPGVMFWGESSVKAWSWMEASGCAQQVDGGWCGTPGVGVWTPITSLHTWKHNCTSHTWKCDQYFSKTSCLLTTAFLVLFLGKDYLALFIYMLLYQN